MAFPFTYPPQKVGPCGGYGGEERDMKVERNDHIRIIKILLYIQGDHEAIKALTVEYECNGRRESKRLWAEWAWERYNRPADEIIFLDQEYITAVSGHIGLYKKWTVIKALRFETNKRTWGPYGAIPADTDQYFELPAVGGRIVGFYGRCGECLDALGVYVQETATVLTTIIEFLRYVSRMLGFGTQGG